MKKTFYRKTTIAVLSFLLFFLLMTQPLFVQAAVQGADATLRVEQRFDYAGSDVNSTFFYVLHPMDSENPMPSGTDAEGNYYFSINGTAGVDVSGMHFVRTGIYTYQVSPVIGEKAKGYTYDTETFTVQVAVKNAKDGGLTAEIKLPVNAAGQKEETISFTNSYKKDAVPVNKTEETKTGDVKSGDDTQIALYISLAAASVGMFFFLFCYKKRREEEDTAVTNAAGRKQS